MLVNIGQAENDDQAAAPLHTSPSSRRLRVLFVYPPVRLLAPPRVPPMGYLYMGAVLEKAGIEVEVLDLNAHRMPIEQAMAEIRRRRFDVIGIGGMTTVYYYIKLLSLMIKREMPQIPIMGGGSACSASPDVVLKNTGVDVVCLGEGEPIVVDLVRALAAGEAVENIPGLAFRAADGQVQKTVARPRFEGWEAGVFPAHHLVDMDLYIKNNAVKYLNVPGMADQIREMGLDPQKACRPVHIFSKRGCPFGCTFCYRNFGRKVVFDGVDHVIDYMAWLSEKYGTQHFVFADELFNVNEKWVLDFCDRLDERKLKYLLSTSNGLRANCCTEKSLRRMREVGFYRVGIGIESFYDPSLQAMKKGQTAQTIKNAIRMIERVGLKLNEGGMLFGYETDDWDAMNANVSGLTELGWFSTGFSIPCPYPGTYLYEKAMALGAITDEEGWLLELADRDIADRVINLSGRSVAELKRIIQWGNDQLAINEMKRRRPRVAAALERAQPVGRKLGLDVIGSLYRLKQDARKLKSGALLRELAERSSRTKRYRHINLGMDGANFTSKTGVGVDGDECDYVTGDRPLLADALAHLQQLKRGPHPRPLPFLVRRPAGDASAPSGDIEGASSAQSADLDGDPAP